MIHALTGNQCQADHTRQLSNIINSVYQAEFFLIRLRVLRQARLPQVACYGGQAQHDTTVRQVDAGYGLAGEGGLFGIVCGHLGYLKYKI